MKIIEAMKRVKNNEEKVTDLQNKIASCSANLSYETPIYGDETKKKLLEFAQSCEDISQENVRLLCAIQRTNLQTKVTIEVGGKQVTKTVAEWVWRRRKYSKLDHNTWFQFNDRGLKSKEGIINTSTGSPMEIKLIKHYDIDTVDNKRELYRSENHIIDSNLEIINATTDLIE